jgi:hypothetical protein
LVAAVHSESFRAFVIDSSAQVVPHHSRPKPSHDWTSRDSLNAYTTTTRIGMYRNT